MPKNDNVYLIKMYESIKDISGIDAADSFVEKLPLSASADYIKKFKWSENVCAYLEGNFNKEKVKQIRMKCSCTPPQKYADDVKRLYSSCDTINDFCEKYNMQYLGKHSIWNEGDSIFFSYPQCYCSLVKRDDKLISKTWCLCTLGYTKKLFDYVLDCETSAELIESVKTGGNRCVMRIDR